MILKKDLEKILAELGDQDFKIDYFDIGYKNKITFVPTTLYVDNDEVEDFMSMYLSGDMDGDSFSDYYDYNEDKKAPLDLDSVLKYYSLVNKRDCIRKFINKYVENIIEKSSSMNNSHYETQNNLLLKINDAKNKLDNLSFIKKILFTSRINIEIDNCKDRMKKNELYQEKYRKDLLISMEECIKSKVFSLLSLENFENVRKNQFIADFIVGEMINVPNKEEMFDYLSFNISKLQRKKDYIHKSFERLNVPEKHIGTFDYKITKLNDGNIHEVSFMNNKNL